MNLRIAFVFVLTFLLTGCAGDRWVELEGHRYQVEVAATEPARMRGLMFRDSMPADHGMLFVHQNEAPVAYWMKNTRIALDIFYFNRNFKLVSMRADVPPCSAGDQCPAYPSTGPALYVLELNAGQARKIGAKQGAILRVGAGIALKAGSD